VEIVAFDAFSRFAIGGTLSFPLFALLSSGQFKIDSALSKASFVTDTAAPDPAVKNPKFTPGVALVSIRSEMRADLVATVTPNA
jgi:hypothetical protein